MKRVVTEGEMFPRGYGLAWWKWETREAVCYPIPLNLGVRWGRDVYHWMRWRSATVRERELVRAYQAGLASVPRAIAKGERST